MGSRAWGSLSVLVLAGAGLVGCNNPQKETKIWKEGPPPMGQAQTQQKPPAFPNQQQQFNQNLGSQGLGNQPKSGTFTPTSNQGPAGFVPHDPFKQQLPPNSQGGLMPKQSSNFNPPPPNQDVWGQKPGTSVPNPNPIDLPNPGAFGTQREGVQITAPPNGFNGGNPSTIAPPPNFRQN